MPLKRQMLLFFVTVALLSVVSSVHDSIFNNFLSATFGLSAGERGGLEFPRELPGLLVVLMAGVLSALSVTAIGVVGAIVFGLGMTGLALFGSHYSPMVLMMMVGSAGMHLLQPVGSSVILALSDDSNRGKRMGQAGAIATVGIIAGTGLVWIFFDRAGSPYRLVFLAQAGVCLLAAAVYGAMHIPHLHQPRARVVLRKRFGLYYLLEFLFGARKQIFITFGPWVLIRVYGLQASNIAKLLMTAALIGVVFRPLAGMAIDRFGERLVMVVDGLVLAVVCIGYGYAMRFAGSPAVALQIACVCYILDDLLFALGTARSVYLSRMTESPQELTSSLALGVSVNHLASMTIPFFAGMVWDSFGYERVFLGAALLALGIGAVSTRVPRRRVA